MSRGNYHTKQKKVIYDLIENMNCAFTVKDIYQKVSSDISSATVYRFIDQLVSDGVLSKYEGKDHSIYYQYIKHCDCLNHVYLRCDKCGSLVHVECDFMEELSEHIFYHHQFFPNKDHIIINGICKNCLKGVN